MIRLAKIEDVAGILEITNEVILNSDAIYREEPLTLERRMEWFKDKISKKYPIWVYERDHTICGFATYGPFRENPGYLYTVEHSLHIHKDYRGQGIARVLMNALIDDVSKKGYKTLIGVIDSKNVSSIRLHEKLGFVLSGTLQNVGFKFGHWLDACFYQLNLPGPKKDKNLS